MLRTRQATVAFLRQLNICRAVSTGTIPANGLAANRLRKEVLCGEALAQRYLLPCCQSIAGARRFSGAPPNTIETVTERVFLVLRLYDKIDPEKLGLDTHLMDDLGLDSLDHVEVICAIEEEFVTEIPDQESERLWTPRQIINYICDKDDIYT